MNKFMAYALGTWTIIILSIFIWWGSWFVFQGVLPLYLEIAWTATLVFAVTIIIWVLYSWFEMHAEAYKKTLNNIRNIK